MRKCVLLLLFAAAMIGCDMNDERTTGTITIVPLGNYIFSGIRMERDGDDANYAARESTISSTTSYEVPPGYYYVFLRYASMSSGVSGWWQTTSDTRFNVAAGEEWVIEYGYSGGNVRKK